MKLKLKQLRRLAKAIGYTGDENDGAAMLALVNDHGLDFDLDGTTVKAADIQLEAVKKAVSVGLLDPGDEDDGEDSKVTKGKKSKDDEDYERDRDTIDDTKFVARAKRLGLLDENGKRPTIGAITVKSMEEVDYEARIKSGEARFPTYDAARGFTDFIQTKSWDAKPGTHVPHALRETVMKRLQKNPVTTKAYGSNTTAGGGAFTGVEFSTYIIRNVNRYGVLPSCAWVYPMQQETVSIPRSTGFPTLYYTPQNGTIIQSTSPTFSNIFLNVKNGKAVVQWSNELQRDAMVAVGDHFADTMAQSIALTEDFAGFNGDGNQTMTANGLTVNIGGMRGLRQAFLDLGAGTTLATAAGSVAAGADWSAYTYATFSTMIGKLPQYARPNAKWYCAPEFQDVLTRVASSMGGVTYREFGDLGELMVFRGKPVVPVNVMNTSTNPTANVTPDLYYGDMTKSLVLGRRQEVRIDVSDQAYWEQDAIGMRATVGHDINPFDVGSASVVGPMVVAYTT